MILTQFARIDHEFREKLRERYLSGPIDSRWQIVIMDYQAIGDILSIIYLRRNISSTRSTSCTYRVPLEEAERLLREAAIECYVELPEYVTIKQTNEVNINQPRPMIHDLPEVAYLLNDQFAHTGD